MERHPKSAKKQGIQGRVIVSFVVNRNGSIVDIKIRKSPDNSLSTEAERLVKMMPKWIPGKKDNKPVRSLFNLPINFRLN